jgi:hypothetical protein
MCSPKVFTMPSILIPLTVVTQPAFAGRSRTLAPLHSLSPSPAVDTSENCFLKTGPIECKLIASYIRNWQGPMFGSGLLILGVYRSQRLLDNILLRGDSPLLSR